jgi:hypothetical protein
MTNTNVVIHPLLSQTKNKVMAFSLQANYTEWVTTTGPRNLARGQSSGTFTAVNLSFLDRKHYSFFFSSSYSFIIMGLGGPGSRPLLFRKSGSSENWTQNLWACSQKLWQLGHRGSTTVSKTKNIFHCITTGAVGFINSSVTSLFISFMPYRV